MSTTKHGGAREGAGPKPKFDKPMVRLRATVPEGYLEFIEEEVGDGNRSEGVRRLVQFYAEQHDVEVEP